MLTGLLTVEIQQTIAFWKAESLSFSDLKESADFKASIRNRNFRRPSDRGAVRFKIADFKASIRTRCLEAFLRSKFNTKKENGKLRVSGIQFRKNLRLRMRLSRDMAFSNRTSLWSDASGVFESHRSAVRRLCRRASRGNLVKTHRFHEFRRRRDAGGVSKISLILRCRFEIAV